MSKRIFRVHTATKPGTVLQYDDGRVHVIQNDGSHRNPERPARLRKKERVARQRMLKAAAASRAEGNV